MFRRPIVPEAGVPLAGVGSVEDPSFYHVHDGTLFFVGGTVDGTAASGLLAAENLFPILDAEGRALASVWIGDFTAANLGVHHEFQFSLFATARKSDSSVPSHPYSVFNAILGHRETLMVCHGLWNDTERVVKYNRDLLALNAQFAISTVQSTGNHVEFAFTNVGGSAICTGRLAIQKQEASAPRELMRRLGFWTLMKTAFASSLQIPVANTRKSETDFTMVSRTYSRYRKQVTRLFKAEDHLALGVSPYREIDFRPLCVQHMQGFELAFMPPTPLAQFGGH